MCLGSLFGGKPKSAQVIQAPPPPPVVQEEKADEVEFGSSAKEMASETDVRRKRKGTGAFRIDLQTDAGSGSGTTLK